MPVMGLYFMLELPEIDAIEGKGGKLPELITSVRAPSIPPPLVAALADVRFLPPVLAGARDGALLGDFEAVAFFLLILPIGIVGRG